nr:zonadhesin-like protein 6 [Plectrocnemia conspersa]
MSKLLQFLIILGVAQRIFASTVPIGGCNEVYVKCSTKGEPTCDNPNPKSCVSFTGFRCKPEYVRLNGICIKQCDCPPKCDANEEYVISCIKGEPTFDNRNPISCKPFTGCRCKSGHVRLNGKCIKECDCPIVCTGSHEEYVINCIKGEPTCDCPNPPSCSPFTGCRCKSGYVRLNGICIKQCDCPPKCNANEEYVISCIKGEQTCDNLYPYLCEPFTGCRCKSGYVRFNGKCIKECDCPPKCNDNEEYVISCVKGEPTCDNRNPISCRPFTGCRCKPGYVRFNEKCIKECDCPPKCNANEEYVVSCINGEPTCDNRSPISCKPFTGCRCKSGYVRFDGKCIKECDCPPKCNNNEEYVINCIKGEPTCDNRNPISCRPFTGCRCKPGYVRFNEKCIKECDCPPKCNDNEEYVTSCIKGEPTCDNRNPIACRPFTGCRCKPGYVRFNKKCIKECDCPPKCNANEEYVISCIKGEPTCDNRNPISCRPFTGCRCKSGYVRLNGICVKECECPLVCTGSHEEYVINCIKGEPTCDCPNPLSCSPFTGCRCKSGYVRLNGICIQSCDCSPIYG